MFGYLLLTILLLSLAAYGVGEMTARRFAANGAAPLHSLPSYHGAFVAVWVGVLDSHSLWRRIAYARELQALNEENRALERENAALSSRINDGLSPATVERVAREVFAFLGLEWDEAVRDFAAAAETRAAKTPSYEKVRQGLSLGVQSNWRNYGFLFQSQEAAPLMKWVEFFGYPLK